MSPEGVNLESGDINYKETCRDDMLKTEEENEGSISVGYHEMGLPSKKPIVVAITNKPSHENLISDPYKKLSQYSSKKLSFKSKEFQSYTNLSGYLLQQTHLKKVTYNQILEAKITGESLFGPKREYKKTFSPTNLKDMMLDAQNNVSPT